MAFNMLITAQDKQSETYSVENKRKKKAIKTVRLGRKDFKQQQSTAIMCWNKQTCP